MWITFAYAGCVYIVRFSEQEEVLIPTLLQLYNEEINSMCFCCCWNMVAVELSFWIIAVIHSDLCGTSIQHRNSYIAWTGCQIQGVALFLLNESQVGDFIDKVIIHLYWTFNCLHFQMYNFILWWWNNETPQLGKGCIWCCCQWKTFCWTKTTRDARC